MAQSAMKLGKEKIQVSVPDEGLLGTLESRPIPGAGSEEEVIRRALENPVNSPKLRDLVRSGESVCIVICDITRVWQRPHVYLPLLLKELERAGVKDEDITFLSGTGTHRDQTSEEHQALLGDLSSRFSVVDNHCEDRSSLVHVGVTSLGTPVEINKRALESDHVVITGAVVYHFMAGWGGGRKAILPGIAGRETVMKNHSLALLPSPGTGRNMNCRSGNLEGNLIHQDMMEAAAMVAPSFALNVVIGSGTGTIDAALAGDWKEAHLEATQIVDQADGVPITEKADVVIASAGGYPKDINFYQVSKTIMNGYEAVKHGGALIILGECSEGYGNGEVQFMLQDFHTQEEREAELRREFTIAKYVGYFVGQVARDTDFYLVSRMDPKELEGTGIIPIQSLEQAMEMISAKGRGPTIWLMPTGASVLPKISG
ncbi:MAG: hypothetical protein CSA35_02655 [Dethiosulfovibrio peptidovorans]|nr:MAG: hypothetical protein CSA35_02655 [Dethiosulfovibrio peptidovorans]